MGDSPIDHLISLTGLGDSPDHGYYSGEKSGYVAESESSKQLSFDDSAREYATPTWSLRYVHESPDNVSKPRKRVLKSQPIFDSDSSPYELAQKVADNLQRRPNLTMGQIVGGVIMLATIIIVYRINSLQTSPTLQDKSWLPSTVKGRQNGKYASIEYAHEQFQKRKEFKVVDEDGNLLGGKKASIQFANDLRNKKALDTQLDGVDSNIMVMDNEIIDRVTLQNSNKLTEESDDEEDYYEAMQLLDDLKKMGDLLQEKSIDSEVPQKSSNDAKEPSGQANAERLKKLKAFENFSTTKLRPLDLGLDDPETTSSAPEEMDLLAKDTPQVVEKAEKQTATAFADQKSDMVVPNKRKRNKSFNKLYNAYSAKIWRLIEKKKNKLQNKTQNQKRSVDDEDDPFRFV
jgi:hypothetical protein